MPRPPGYDPLNELKFITNYLLAGCEPPYDLFVEFSQAPAKDLAMLILLPDLVDLGQAVFEPSKGRRRRPARHGRKRPHIPGIPDTSDILGQKVRGWVNPHDALNFGATRAAFRIWNAYEGVAFSAAILDGLVDIGYETLWGVLSVDPDHCTNFPRLSRQRNTGFLVGGAGPPIWPVPLDILDFATGFFGANTGAVQFEGTASVTLSLTLMNAGTLDNVRGQAALGVIGGGVRAESREVYLGPGEIADVEVNAEFDAGENFEWGVSSRTNNPVVIRGSVLAYVKQAFPWPW